MIGHRGTINGYEHLKIKWVEKADVTKLSEKPPGHFSVY